MPIYAGPDATGNAVIDAPLQVDLRRRIAWLALLRMLVLSVALGVSIWVATNDQAGTSSAIWMLSGVVVLTLLCTVGYGIALRRAVSPTHIARTQMMLDIPITSMMVYLTGGVKSPYVLLYALSVVTAAALLYRRGAVVSTLMVLVAFLVVGTLSWQQLFQVPLAGGLRPFDLSTSEFARALSANLASLVGVGALGYIFGDQLERAALSLESERRTVGQLYSLHQDIVQSLTSGLVTLDNSGKLLTMNRSASEILHCDADSMRGKPLDAVLPGLTNKLASQPGGEVRRIDLTIGVDGVDKSIGVSVSALYDAKQDMIGRVVNFQDLTELRRMELHVHRAERLATVGQLAAGVAHEIRNPLAAISGSIELLQQAPQVSDDDRTLMTIVTREIDRLNGLITDLLDYANPRPRQVVDFDVATLVEETVQVAQQDRTHSDVSISFLARPSVLPTRGDPAKLRQVVWNLLRNASDAANAGRKTVSVDVSRTQSEIAIAIADSGPGIPEDQQARIFDPFFTTKKRGTGLGLATCHSIVMEHGGRIDVKSSNEGTVITVVLPDGVM
jgi:two-component system, NtrC family, sensor histidine kinase PilS